MISVYCKNRRKRRNAVCGKNTGFYYVEVGGTYSNLWALKGLRTDSIMQNVSWRVHDYSTGHRNPCFHGFRYFVTDVVWINFLLRRNSSLQLKHCNVSQDSSVGIATCYRLDGRFSIPGRGKRFFSTARRSGRLWSPTSLLANGYQGLFSGD
jgi:hypothetical protein